MARQRIGPGEARLLLAHLLGRNAAYLAAHGEDELDATAEAHYLALVARRYAGEPIAYLTQTREFYGRPFAVSADVLIPRSETELIVDVVREKFGRDAAMRILDMGTGSGCLAITLALELAHAEVTALDVSTAALDVAQRNGRSLGAAVRFLASDWFAAVGGERFDLIVANPPYIAEQDPHLAQGDLRYEPSRALSSGVDGQEALRHIVRNAQAHLRRGGWLLLEHGYDQGEAVRGLLAAAGYADIEQFRDLAGILRVSGGRAPG